MSKILSIALIFNALIACAQLVEVPIAPGSSTQYKNKNSSARIQSLTPMPLPFWDDFSFTQEKDFPNDTLWVSRQTVWVNQGRGINPPSIFTATFDGIDSTGKPYDLNDVLAKGFADKLISRPIVLDALPASQKDSLYLSFFYQVTGKGEAPDLDDNFSLWFRDENGTWEKVFEVKNSISLDPTVFYYAIIKVEEKFRHANFQFKFQNFARLSGPYDTWNLDYVYLNSKRWATDFYFPDRTIVKPITSILGRYRAIPMKHYVYSDTAKTIMVPPSGALKNLYQVVQPTNYYTWASIYSRNSGVQSEKHFFLDSLNFGFDLPSGEITEVITNKTIPVDSIDLAADSVVLKLIMSFKSGDEDYIAGVTERFTPTNFFLNDTTTSNFILHKHYAYDDGTAEYGAGLNRPGGLFAYGFPMFTKEIDTLIGVDIYFPEFGDNASQTVILKIWSAANDGTPLSELYRGTIPVKRTSFNTFTRYNLTEPILVKKKFFIGWEQTATVVVPVGLDKNTDSGSAIFSNISGTWEQNQTVQGSLMIHPVFGYGGEIDVVNGTPDELVNIYPNPSQKEFYIPGAAEHISVFNALGVSQLFEISPEENRTKIDLQNPASQLLLVRWRSNGKFYSSRVFIQN